MKTVEINMISASPIGAKIHENFVNVKAMASARCCCSGLCWARLGLLATIVGQDAVMACWIAGPSMRVPITNMATAIRNAQPHVGPAAIAARASFGAMMMSIAVLRPLGFGAVVVDSTA